MAERQLPVGQEVILVKLEDYYLPLAVLAKVSGMSIRKLRAMLADPIHPLPHFRMGKILVRWSEFTRHLEQFRARADVNLDKVVQEVVDDLRSARKGQRPGGPPGR